MRMKFNSSLSIMLFGLLILAMTSVAWAAYGYSSNATVDKSVVINSKEVTIAIKGFMFSPDNVTIKSGTVVTWINNDNVAHNIVIDNVNVTSPDLGKNDKWSYTFNKAGTFTYICAFHSRMKATIIVTD